LDRRRSQADGERARREDRGHTAHLLCRGTGVARALIPRSQGFSPCFRRFRGFQEPCRRADRVSWAILRGRFPSGRPCKAPKTLPFREKAKNCEVLFRFDPLIGVSYAKPIRVESSDRSGFDESMISAWLRTHSHPHPRFARILNVYPWRVRCERRSRNGATVLG